MVDAETRVSNHPTISTDGVLRPTYLEVNLPALTRNLELIRKAAGSAAVMPILKANAYGHGLIEVARHMESLGVPCVGVAYLEEGILLRKAGLRTPILVLGGILGTQVPLFLKYDLQLTASSVEKLRIIDEAASQQRTTAVVHLKVDTGMERIGVHYYSAESLLRASLTCKHVQVAGIFSHFAQADNPDLSSARLQLERFRDVLSFYERHSLPVPTRHMANSAAILNLKESHLDMVRPGILLFGVYPTPDFSRLLDVQPVLSWKSHVVYFKVVRPHHPVSYGGTWESDHPVRMVTVPVGYGDGYSSRLSGHASVIIRDQRYPVVGRICMDQVMVNIEWDSAYNGDEVILVGQSPNHVLRIEDIARWSDTITYEVLTSINTRVPRVYLRDSNLDSTGSDPKP